MSNEAEQSVLSRILKVDEIKDGTRGEIVATEAEMRVIARMLDLVALDGLTLAYRFNKIDGGRLRLAGKLGAKVTQTCVVSLDPVETSLDLPIEVEFWPAGLVDEFERSADESGNHELVDWPDTVVDGKIDLGPVIYETLATALDPYPRKEGASFQWSQAQGGEGRETGKSGPFAALAALKRR
jgi:uncharacterized metal-binding protein YceD (DUF177 family)